MKEQKPPETAQESHREPTAREEGEEEGKEPKENGADQKRPWQDKQSAFIEFK